MVKIIINFPSINDDKLHTMFKYAVKKNSYVNEPLNFDILRNQIKENQTEIITNIKKFLGNNE